MGTRFRSTPINRGHNPDSEAPIGFARNVAFASPTATFGATVFPLTSLAYCCTSWRYAVTGLSPTVWMALPPR